MLHGGEYQFGVADVFDVVQQVFAGAEVEVPGLTRLVGDITGGAVERVLTAAAGIDRRPEVIEHMAMRMPALSRREPDLPHPNSRILAQQPRPDVSVIGMLGKLGLEPIRPAVEVVRDEFPG